MCFFYIANGGYVSLTSSKHSHHDANGSQPASRGEKSSKREPAHERLRNYDDTHGSTDESITFLTCTRINPLMAGPPHVRLAAVARGSRSQCAAECSQCRNGCMHTSTRTTRLKRFHEDVGGSGGVGAALAAGHAMCCRGCLMSPGRPVPGSPDMGRTAIQPCILCQST